MFRFLEFLRDTIKHNIATTHDIEGVGIGKIVINYHPRYPIFKLFGFKDETISFCGSTNSWYELPNWRRPIKKIELEFSNIYEHHEENGFTIIEEN